MMHFPLRLWQPFLVVLSCAASLAAHPEQVPAPDAAGPATPVAFSGLRRVPESSARAVLDLREGLLPARDVHSAMKKLHRTGWFDSIRAERNDGILIFAVEERPFLAAVAYAGSRALRREQIEAALEAAQAQPLLARPTDPVRLHRATRVITHLLQEMGHPFASVD
ncbi:MAG: hypothetical protein HY046_09470, partial [Acidobacteria bacterium]|nr:hypothetical protein [Acidobacteriota bacterium]